MKTISRILVIVATLLALCPVFSGQAQSPLPDNPNPITNQTNNNFLYLPFVLYSDSTALTSIELIDQAVETGQISAEQGLIYKAFAVWGDPRLPDQYKGADDENAGDRVMREITEKKDTLSSSAWNTLMPFFQPPTETGSWWQMRHSAGIVQSTMVNSWQFVSAAETHIKIFYWTGEPDFARQAGVIKAAVDGKIWPDEKKLMNREPKYGTGDFTTVNIYLWNSYAKQDGTVVPFSGTRGVTLAPDCADTYSWIYINNTRVDGDATHPGMLQTVAHELFHAFQNSYAMVSCSPYDWLSEATAKWVEDFVYPDANSEQPYAVSYLDFAYQRLDKTGNNHEYGAYLLPYYITKITGDDITVRRMWENSEKYANSYVSVREALPASFPNFKESFWGSYLLTLWNKAPYPTFFQEKDKFTGSVKPEWASPVNVTASGAASKKEFTGDLPTGAVRYYPLTFDSSVRSLAFLNGLTFNMRKDSVDNSQWGSELTDPADQTYASDPLPDAEQKGITAYVMYKRAGKTTWEMMPFGATDEFPYCVNTMGKIESAVVVLSNEDWDHPDRVVKSPGINSMIFATNMPCAGYKGTSTITNYNHGVSDIYHVSNISYKSGSTAQYSFPTFPFISFELQGASVSWTKSGTDSAGCTYSGSDSFSIGPHPGAGSDTVVLFSGVLSGSPSYRGYQGGATSELRHSVYLSDDLSR